MRDSGKREQFDSGAVRDTAEGKSRPDLVSPYAEDRIGQWMAEGALKYDERNWEKGMRISRCVASISRHLIAFKMGLQDEDHLAAIAVNAQFIMHYQAMIGVGKLPITLDDMPDYEDVIEVQDEIPELDEYNAAEIDGPIPELEAVKPRFIKGDMVCIKLRSDTGDYTRQPVDLSNGTGIYMGSSDTGHEVILAGSFKHYWFYDDELFPMEGGG